MPKHKIIEKQEIIYAFIGIVFIIGWFLFLKPLVSPFLSSLHPFIAMLIYAVALFIGTYFLTYVLNNTKMHLKIAFISFLILLSFDILMAPYGVFADGTINTSIDMWYVSTDAAFASLYALFLPMSKVWFATYVITPFMLGFLIPVLIGKSKQIGKALSK